MAFLGGGIDEEAIAIVGVAFGIVSEGAGILPRIDTIGDVERVPVGEAGDAVLWKEPRGEAMIDGRIISAPNGRVTVFEDLRMIVRPVPAFGVLHEGGIAPHFFAGLTPCEDLVRATGPFHVIPDAAEVGGPDVHAAMQLAPRGFFRCRLFGDEQRHFHAVLLFDLVEELAPSAHGGVGIGVVRFVEITHDDIAATCAADLFEDAGIRRDVLHRGLAILAEWVFEGPVRPDGDADGAGVAMQQLLAQRTLDFFLIEAAIGLRKRPVDLINGQAMPGEHIVVLIEELSVLEREARAVIFKAVDLRNTARRGHDGGAQTRHDGQIEVPNMKREIRREAGAISEAEAQRAFVITGDGVIRHEDIDPEGLVRRFDCGMRLGRHVERQQRIGILAGRQRGIHRALADADVVLVKNLRRGQSGAGFMQDRGGIDIDLLQLFR